MSEIEKVMEAVKELRAEVDSKSGFFNQEKVQKIEEFLDAQEEKDQARQKELAAAEAREEEIKERFEALELEIARSGGAAKSDYRESDNYKALQGFVIKGSDIDQEMKALLRTDSDTAGGYLVMGEMDNEITKGITEISDIRSIARVRSISSKSLEMPIRKGILVATFEGEGESDDDSVSNYGNETVTPYRQSVTIPITMDQLQDSNFNMEAEIFSDAGEAFAVGEGIGHVSGSGVKAPEGFLTHADLVAGARVGTASGTVGADDVILMTGDLKTGYKPVYVMNRRTLATLRTLKATDNSYLWQPGMNGVVASTLNGHPYILANAMPDLAANSLSIAFGDFRRGYTIVDRTGVSVTRDDVTKKKQAIVEFTVRRWTTGMVVLPEAIKLLKTAA